MAFQPTPGQLDAARRILSHNHKRPYGPGSRGTTVRAIKIYLANKGFDPGKLNGEWDDQTTRAFERAVPGGASRATPSVLRKLSKDFGAPGPRPKKIDAAPAPALPKLPSSTVGDLKTLGDGDTLGAALAGLGGGGGLNSDMGGAQLGDLASKGQMGFPDAGAPVDPSAVEQPAFGVPASPMIGRMPGDPETQKDDFVEQSVEEPPAPGVPPDAGEAMKTREFNALNAGGADLGPGDPAMLGKPPLPPSPGLPAPDSPPAGGLSAADLVGDGSAPGSVPSDLGSLQPTPPDASGDVSPAMGPAGNAGSGNPPMGDPSAPPPDAMGSFSTPGVGPPMVPGSGMDLGALAGSGSPPMGDPSAPGDLGALSPPPMPRPRPENASGMSPSPEMAGTKYKIQSKDTLWDIAEREYGDPRLWPIIAKANPQIKNPNLIYAGRTITIPDVGGA